MPKKKQRVTLVSQILRLAQKGATAPTILKKFPPGKQNSVRTLLTKLCQEGRLVTTGNRGGYVYKAVETAPKEKEKNPRKEKNRNDQVGVRTLQALLDVVVRLETSVARLERINKHVGGDVAVVRNAAQLGVDVEEELPPAAR